MLPVKKVLCPTDYSDFSYQALDVAVEFCEKFKAKLYLVHVIAPVPQSMGMPTSAGFDIPMYQEQLKEHNQESLKKVTEEKIPDKIQTESLIGYGFEADSIIKVAEEKDVDLIVISTHGRTGLKHFFLGSVAEKVLRHTSKPVLTIRASE
ncbi:MAG: universal stress protein [bacterium]